jgi:hypothetical protein
LFAPVNLANLGDRVEIKPRKKGVYLNRKEALGLDQLMDRILNEVPEEFRSQIGDGVPCSVTHENGEGALCAFCCPFAGSPMAIGSKPL